VSTPRQRLDGYRLAHERWARVDESLVVEATSAVAARGGGAVLVGRGVDGIVAGNDEMAIGAMWACTALGVSIPGDVAVVGFDGTGSGLDTHGDVTLSSVVQPFDRLADTAVAMLNDIVEGRQVAGAVSIARPRGRWIVGAQRLRPVRAGRRAARLARVTTPVPPSGEAPFGWEWGDVSTNRCRPSGPPSMQAYVATGVEHLST
jgi:hypothetical protein